MKKLLLALLFVTSSAFAGQCDQLYVGSKQLVIANTIELCNSFYVVAYDKSVKGPKVSFERFDAGKPKIARADAFRPDTRLAPTERAELIDYRNSGYDRGHMTPAADAGNSIEMSDTFLLSNMTPQSKKLNEGNWKDLETHIRNKAKGITYVATGAIYGNGVIGKNKIHIPTQYYKIVWYSDHTTEAYYTDNKDTASIMSTSVEKVNAMSGIAFPK